MFEVIEVDVKKAKGRHVRKDLVDRLSSGTVDRIDKREAARRSKDLIAKFTQSPKKTDQIKEKRIKMKE